MTTPDAKTLALAAFRVDEEILILALEIQRIAQANARPVAEAAAALLIVTMLLPRPDGERTGGVEQ